jgi:hypothetical protein
VEYTFALPIRLHGVGRENFNFFLVLSLAQAGQSQVVDEASESRGFWSKFETGAI